jgi:hypothetical protein
MQIEGEFELTHDTKISDDQSTRLLIALNIRS